MISSMVVVGALTSCAIFWYILVCCAYITWTKQFKPFKALTMIISMVVVGALTSCALLHSDLKAAQ